VKFGELLDLLTLAHPDADVVISDGGKLRRVSPGPVLADFTREPGRGGHVELAGGKNRVLADAAVLIDQESGARGAVVLTLK